MIKPLAIKIASSTTYRVERALSAGGEIVVRVGDAVQPGTPIARVVLPAPPAHVSVAEMLGVRAKDLAAYLVKQVGDQVKAKEVIARKRGSLLWGKKECVSPIDGTFEFVSFDSGQVTIRRPERQSVVWADAPGKITAIVARRSVVIETGAAVIQGAFGVGGEIFGTLKVLGDGPDGLITGDRLDRSCLGCVLVGGGIEDDSVLAKALAVGARGLILGSVRATGHENWQTLGSAFSPTIVVTDGFGVMGIYPPAFDILLRNQGKQTWLRPDLNGRAEAVILLSDEPLGRARSVPDLAPGSRVRLVRSPFFGLSGRVLELSRRPQEIESGLRAPVATIELDDGRKITTPVANLELIY